MMDVSKNSSQTRCIEGIQTCDQVCDRHWILI